MKTIKFFNKDIKVLNSADVVVIGGGTAGSVAAISVLLEGKSCIVVEKSNALGGTATNGLVIPFKYNFFFTWNKPQANDIVIFLHDNKIVIKRCVATSGQQLDFLDDTEYSLIVGNKKIILTEEQFSKMKQFDKVPEGYILAIGDNYYNSVDSRSYGFISEKNVIGKIITNE